MINTVFATKLSMTQTWDKEGRRLPITVVAALKHTITQLKSTKTDGYTAVQLALGSKRSSLINKPLSGHLKKAGDLSPVAIRELRLPADSETNFKLGDTLSPEEILQPGDQIKVTGTSKGKGFAGGVKRHGFKGGPKTHGQSDRLRAPGSIGQGTDPGRVWPGKRMAGHMGNTTFTITNLTVVKVTTDGQIWIKGQIPGFTGSIIKITKTGSSNFAGLPENNEAPAPEVSTEDSTNTTPTKSVETPSPTQEPNNQDNKEA